MAIDTHTEDIPYGHFGSSVTGVKVYWGEGKVQHAKDRLLAQKRILDLEASEDDIEDDEIIEYLETKVTPTNYTVSFFRGSRQYGGSKTSIRRLAKAGRGLNSYLR